MPDATEIEDDEFFFQFRGELLPSKSLLNRALILQSYRGKTRADFELANDFDAEDVKHLKKCLNQLRSTQGSALQRFDIGAGGTSLRFFALRVSRLQGEFDLQMDETLARRPIRELMETLKSLGVQAQMSENILRIKSQGWTLPEKSKKQPMIFVDSSRSSQFISALILNAWNLDFDLHLATQANLPSRGYFEMTLKMVQGMGMKFERLTTSDRLEIRIPRGCQMSHESLDRFIEPDMSSVFTLSVAAALNGDIELGNIPMHSVQPDARGLKLLREMGVILELQRSEDFFESGNLLKSGNSEAQRNSGAQLNLSVQGFKEDHGNHEEAVRRGVLKVRKSNSLGPVNVDLSDSPDLFPCLAVLCASACGVSELKGLQNLEFKESNRLQKTIELLQKAGVEIKFSNEMIQIHGRTALIGPEKKANTPIGTINEFNFDPDGDHRMAFAAACMKLLGHRISIQQPQVVNKSFPEFWKILGLEP